MRPQREQQQVPMHQQQVQVREQQRVREQAQVLPLSYHRRPERRQRSRLPKRECCSFLKVE
jgi:hypothetical protein